MVYSSCKEIESGIHLYRNKFNFCCVDFAPNKGFVKMVDYEGGPIPYREIENSRNELRRLNNEEKYSPCCGCPNLVLKDWKTDSQKFNFIAIGNYSLCNQTCEYCYISEWDSLYRREQATPLYDSLDVIRQLIKDDKLDKKIQIVWAGGEPTMYKEFDPLYTLLDSSGYTSSTFIYSNCTKFSPSIHKGLLENKMQLFCSLDSGCVETYKKIKNVDGFNKAISNLEKYIEASPKDVFIKYILLEENTNESEMNKFVDSCKRINAKNIIIARDSLHNKLSSNKLWDGFAYLAFKAAESGIAYSFERTMFSEYDELRAKLRMLKHIENSTKINQDVVKSLGFSNLEEIFLKSVTGYRKFEGNNLVAKKEDDEEKSKEIASLISLANDAIKWRQDYSEAIQLLELAKTIDPFSTDVLYKLSEVYNLSNDSQKEILVLLEISETNKYDKKVFLRISEILIENQDLLGALIILNKCMSNQNPDAEIIKLSEAIEEKYNLLLEINTNSAEEK